MKQRQRIKMQFQDGYTRISAKDSDDSGEETELFIRKTPYQEVPTIEQSIEEGDTLQALSIRYHCPIAELKRLNNIHRENEIYAKRSIKVPVRPISMALASVHVSGTNSPEKYASLSTIGIDADTLQSKLTDSLPPILSTATSSNSLLNGVQVNEVIFNSSVKPVTKNCDNVTESSISEITDEHVSLLDRADLPAETVVSRLSCSGADADISWIALIVCIVILIFAVPLIYVFYIAEHLEQYHHSHYS